MEFTIKKINPNTTCGSCPNITEWRAEIVRDGVTTIAKYGYDPTEELTAERDGKAAKVVPEVTEVSLEEANELAANLDDEAVNEIAELTAELATFEAIAIKDRTDSDRSEIKRIKNRINYLKRKA